MTTNGARSNGKFQMNHPYLIKRNDGKISKGFICGGLRIVLGEILEISQKSVYVHYVDRKRERKE